MAHKLKYNCEDTFVYVVGCCHISNIKELELLDYIVFQLVHEFE